VSADGRIQTGQVDGERSCVTFRAGDVEFPLSVTVRDKRTGLEVEGELSFAEGRRARDTLQESLEAITGAGARSIRAQDDLSYRQHGAGLGRRRR
jgi:hypothetical protein